MSDLPPDLSPAFGGLVEGADLAPMLGSPGSAAARPWWRNLKGPIGVLLADLEASNPLVRRRAAEALVRLGDRRAVPALARRVQDPAWEVRLACIQALGRLGVEGSLPVLHRACHDGHAQVRLAAAAALADHGDAVSLGELLLLAEHLASFGSPADQAAVKAAVARLSSRLERA